MTTFYLIRHGEKAVDPKLLPGRAPGVKLSAIGAAQALRVAECFHDIPLQRIFSSPTERCRETAAPLARAKGLHVEVTPALDEMDLGEWTGKTIDELSSLTRFRLFQLFRSATRVPHGETLHEVQCRVVSAMFAWRETWPDSHIALVTHADPIRAAVAYFAGAPLDFWSRFEIAPASISEIALNSDNVKILRLNDTCDAETHQTAEP